MLQALAGRSIFPYFIRSLTTSHSRPEFEMTGYGFITLSKHILLVIPNVVRDLYRSREFATRGEEG